MNLIGLASCEWARGGSVSREVEVGRLVVMRDWRERHALGGLGETWEVGEWQEDAGDESISVAGVWEAYEGWRRGAQSRAEGRSILRSILGQDERGARSCCLSVLVQLTLRRLL